MNDTTFTLLVIGAGIVLVSCAVGAAIAIVASLAARRERSGLGDEDVAAILGYPMYPAWKARHNGSDRPEDPVA